MIHETFQGSVRVTTLKKGELQTETTNNFLTLPLEIPPPPLFKDEEEKNIIPQVPIFTLLKKYDGETETHDVRTGTDKKFQIIKLPKYLIIHYKRFTKNNFFVEKNPTIVNFPLINLDLKDCLTEEAQKNLKTATKFNLLANIVHDGEATKGAFRVHVLEKSSNTWFELQDLDVKKVQPQILGLSETYVQIYERVGG